MTILQNAKANYKVMSKFDSGIPSFNQFDLNPLHKGYEQFTEPEVIFVRKGLSQTKWKELFTRANSEYYNDTIPEEFFKGKGWEVAVIEATPAPTKSNVAKIDIEKQNLVTCNAEEYLSLQLLKALREDEPVDKETYTIVEEDITVGGGARSLVFGFDPGGRQVFSSWNNRDSSNVSGGVRPSVRDVKSLALNSSSETLSSTDLQENTKAIQELTEVLKGIFKI